MEPIDSVHEKAPPYSSTSTQIPSYVSEEDYWKYYYGYPDNSYEWNNGKLELRPMSDFLSFTMYLWFIRLLEDYLTVYQEGQLMGFEMGLRLNLGQKTTIRKPDLAVIHKNNPTPYELTDRTFKGICDICIEFVSDSTPSEVERDTIVKKLEYAQAGVKEYFIFDKNHQETAFYRLSPDGDYQPISAGAQGVIRSQVLSNFAFRLEHLKSLPKFETLLDDPVYKSFIELALQAERQEKEKERAEKEKERALKEKERAEKEAALKQVEEERQAREKIEQQMSEMKTQLEALQRN